MTARQHRSEKQIEAEIIKNLRLLGFAVTKTSQHQQPRGMTGGVPDLYVSHARWQLRLWIEVKTGDNRPSPHQLAWHAAERAAGGTVVVAWSWSDVQTALHQMGAPLALPAPPLPRPSGRSGTAAAGRPTGSRTRRSSTK